MSDKRPTYKRSTFSLRSLLQKKAENDGEMSDAASTISRGFKDRSIARFLGRTNDPAKRQKLSEYEPLSVATGQETPVEDQESHVETAHTMEQAEQSPSEVPTDSRGILLPNSPRATMKEICLKSEDAWTHFEAAEHARMKEDWQAYGTAMDKFNEVVKTLDQLNSQLPEERRLPSFSPGLTGLLSSKSRDPTVFDKRLFDWIDEDDMLSLYLEHIDSAVWNYEQAVEHEHGAESEVLGKHHPEGGEGDSGALALSRVSSRSTTLDQLRAKESSRVQYEKFSSRWKENLQASSIYHSHMSKLRCPVFIDTVDLSAGIRNAQWLKVQLNDAASAISEYSLDKVFDALESQEEGYNPDFMTHEESMIGWCLIAELSGRATELTYEETHESG